MDTVTVVGAKLLMSKEILIPSVLYWQAHDVWKSHCSSLQLGLPSTGVAALSSSDAILHCFPPCSIKIRQICTITTTVTVITLVAGTAVTGLQSGTYHVQSYHCTSTSAYLDELTTHTSARPTHPHYSLFLKPHLPLPDDPSPLFHQLWRSSKWCSV